MFSKHVLAKSVAHQNMIGSYHPTTETTEIAKGICNQEFHPIVTMNKEEIALQKTTTDDAAKLFFQKIDSSLKLSHSFSLQRDTPEISGYACIHRLQYDIAMVQVKTSREKITVAKQSLTVTVPEKLAFIGELGSCVNLCHIFLCL